MAAIRSVCLLLTALAFASCAAPRLRVTDIPIAKDATFDLMSPASLGQSISLEQIVDAKYGDKEFSFHCLLEVDPKQLVLVGMTPMNTRAFTLTLSDEQLTIDMAPGAKLPADPSRILADLQLALWPEPAVKGLQAQSMDHGLGYFGKLRSFVRNDSHVIKIFYEAEGDDEPRWSGLIILLNVEQDYSLMVRTVRAETLAP